MECGYEFEDEAVVSGSPPGVATFHLSDEGNVKVGMIRKQGMTNVRRRRNVSKASVDEDTRDSFDRIRQKFSAIHGPADLNNNRGGSGVTDLYSTPVNFKKRDGEKFFTPGMGASPEGDSGFNDDYSSPVSEGGAGSLNIRGLKATLSTPIKELFSSPNEKFFEEKKTSHTFSTSFSTKKGRRLFESSNTSSIFGVTFKIDEVIPVLVLAFVALSAVVTVTTLTTALRRSHGVSRPAPNGKYRSIQFAHDQLTQPPAGEESDKFQVLDEEGNVLGGKRAAIQFAYDLKEEDSPLPTNEENNGQRHFDGLDLFRQIEEMTADDEAVGKPGEGEVQAQMSDEEKRERLMSHINSFGHFATSQVANLQRKKRAAAKKSKNNHPFKVYSNKIDNDNKGRLSR